MEPVMNDSLTRALDLTHALESAVSQQDWARASAIVEERSPLLMSLRPEQTPEALDKIRAIQRIDAGISQQTRTGMDRLTERHGDALRRIKSVSMYHSTGML
ncbi:flagellar protein FliT [Paraburkholderia hospita]|uniref:Flagellar protein FliT n=2 Tax=Paraburkholderia hospita TaxID=169430 RepID=A0AAN1MK25_9BURK|nr:flagellar protein FliT [Paraburkholderia hospita]OUL76346.1 flagellar protein FliT [Paraburkholderia hospita]